MAGVSQPSSPPPASLSSPSLVPFPGLNFNSLDGILANLQGARRPFFTRGQYGFAVDAFFEGPLGQIYEAVGIKQSILNSSQVETWNLCGPL